MSVWAIADLHLSFGVPDKSMNFFGKGWENWTEKLEANWKKHISSEDLVLLPGDISWAMQTQEAVPDLEWIHRLPGTKIMLKGNHDYWWTSLSKVEKVLPSSIHLIQNNAYLWNGIAIAGTRLWDTSEYQFGSFIDYKDNPRAKKLSEVDHDKDEMERIFVRELSRLEMSLKTMSPKASRRIAMTHYPPIGADLKESRASAILKKYGVSDCVFGHLHNVRDGALPFGNSGGVRYTLVSGDYLKFMPVKIV